MAAGSVATSCSASQNSPIVAGSRGGNVVALPLEKPRAEVRSPNVWRRQALMLGSVIPVTRSRNWSVEVWSNCSEATKPPTVHGEMMKHGTRTPPPIGQFGWPGFWTNSSGVPAGGSGGTTWSKMPSFSS